VEQQPIFSIRTPHAASASLKKKKTLSTPQSCVPLLQQSGHIFGVNCTGPTPTPYLFQRQTQELQPALIEVIEITVGPPGMD